MKVLITGAAGFVGKNLSLRLQELKQVESLFLIDKDSPRSELEAALLQADFIFHLAGVNRPKEEKEFAEVNQGLTQEITQFLQAQGLKPGILVSSSTQAALDNPYGSSKKGAEEALLAWHQATGGAVYLFRLPGLFGKWSLPNYNAVTSTFCHNVAHGLPLQINAPEHELTLAYIDDVLDCWVELLLGRLDQSPDHFYQVPVTHRITLGKLAETIQSFKDSRESLFLPNFADPLVKKLYGTYVSYLPRDGFYYDLPLKSHPSDDRGQLWELVKSQPFGQIFFSTTLPGKRRGGHYHHTKVEKFMVIQGKAVVRFRHLLESEIIEVHCDSRQALRVVDIPTGYTHDIINQGEGELLVLFWSNEPFDPSRPDTHSAPVEV